VDGYAEKEFDSKYWAAGGALYDMGVYHISLMQYLLGVPKVLRVSGQVYQELAMDEKRRAESGFDVEELGCGFVKFENDLTMDILESWAIHAGEFPPSMIAGSEGGLSIWPTGGGDGSALVYYNEISGYPVTTNIDLEAEEYRRSMLDPSHIHYRNSQTVWVAAMRGQCPWPETTRVALNTTLISEGIFMSGRLGREVTRDEIVSGSRSLSLTKQETPFGVIEY